MGQDRSPVEGYLELHRASKLYEMCPNINIIHSYYFTPLRLNRMGLLNNDLCLKCGGKSDTFIHPLWECSKVLPLRESVIDYMGNWLNCELPRSPRLCVLGDRTMVPHLNRSIFRILKTSLMTCEQTILRCWGEPQIPTLNIWRTQMMETVACEKMLGTLNWQIDMTNKQWDSFSRYMMGGNSQTM